MKLDDLRQVLWDAYADLSPQMKVAASYVLENPADVAFKSVRQLAKAADVSSLNDRAPCAGRWLLDLRPVSCSVSGRGAGARCPA